MKNSFFHMKTARFEYGQIQKKIDIITSQELDTEEVRLESGEACASVLQALIYTASCAKKAPGIAAIPGAFVRRGKGWTVTRRLLTNVMRVNPDTHKKSIDFPPGGW